MNVLILLDRTQSMGRLWNEAVSSVNSYVKKLKLGDSIHLALFDSMSYDVIRDCKVKGWVDLDPKEYQPRAMTPLYDACGKIMLTAEAKNGKKTVVVIMTDGEENSSKEFTRASITAKMKQFDERGWEVIFLGAAFQDVEKVSNSLDRISGKTMNYAVGNFDKGMEFLAASTRSYAATGASINFSDAIKKEVSNSDAK